MPEQLTYRVSESPAVCGYCGSNNAVHHLEHWSDGFLYYEKYCKDCGWYKVVE